MESENNLLFSANTSDRIFKLIQKTFSSLNINTQVSYINSLKDYFDLSIDSKEDNETLVSILSMLIIHGYCILSGFDSVIQIKLRFFRDQYTPNSLQWNRINTLLYFYTNEVDLMQINSKETPQAHTDKLILYALLDSSFKDKGTLMNKMVDVLSMMSIISKGNNQKMNF